MLGLVYGKSNFLFIFLPFIINFIHQLHSHTPLHFLHSKRKVVEGKEKLARKGLPKFIL